MAEIFLIYWEFGDDVKDRVMQHMYFDTMLHLRAAIKNKHTGLLAKKLCLLHDNARPHTAQLIANLLESFHWEAFKHSPYSPDLASSDYHIFPGIKKELGG